jgi:hypothetical protein
MIKMTGIWGEGLLGDLGVMDVLVNSVARSDRDDETVMDILNTWKEMIEN